MFFFFFVRLAIHLYSTLSPIREGSGEQFHSRLNKCLLTAIDDLPLAVSVAKVHIFWGNSKEFQVIPLNGYHCPDRIANGFNLPAALSDALVCQR